jgi:recombinational DNA repair protein RecT
MHIDALVVREHDRFEIILGSNPLIVHTPELVDTSGPVGFYAIALKGDYPLFDYMSVEEVEAHAKRYTKARSGPFSEIASKGRKAENFEAYGLKTVLLRLVNRKLDMSSSLSRAVSEEYELEGQGEAEKALIAAGPEVVAPEADSDAIWASIKAESDAKVEKLAAEEVLPNV